MKGILGIAGKIPVGISEIKGNSQDRASQELQGIPSWRITPGKFGKSGRNPSGDLRKIKAIPGQGISRNFQEFPCGQSLPALPNPVLPQKVMEAMGVLAIVVNCYLIAQCGQLQRLFPGLSPEGAIVSVVVLEVRAGIGVGIGVTMGSPRGLVGFRVWVWSGLGMGRDGFGWECPWEFKLLGTPHKSLDMQILDN